MKVKLTGHARNRLKERFHGCPSFGGDLDEKNLKFVHAIPHNDANIYHYKWAGHPMYLLIGARIPRVITVFSPSMYYMWEIRYALKKVLMKTTSLIIKGRSNRYFAIKKFLDFLLPHVN